MEVLTPSVGERTSESDSGMDVWLATPALGGEMMVDNASSETCALSNDTTRCSSGFHPPSRAKLAQTA